MCLHKGTCIHQNHKIGVNRIIFIQSVWSSVLQVSNSTDAADGTQHKPYKAHQFNTKHGNICLLSLTQFHHVYTYIGITVKQILKIHINHLYTLFVTDSTTKSVREEASVVL